MGEEIETTGIISQVGPRVRLEGMHHVRELDRVTDKERREVVADQVPVTVCGIELGGKTAWVAQGFGRVVAMHHRRETHKHRGDFTASKHFGFGQIAEVVGHRKCAVSARATGVNDPLRDALTVKALEFLQQLDVLQQHRAIGPGCLRILVIAYASTVIAGQRGCMDRSR